MFALVGLCLLACVVLFPIVALVMIRPARARSALRTWAESNGFALHEAKLQIFGAGPFQGIICSTFRILVTDSDGAVRRGQAFAGSDPFPFFSPKADVDVIWDPPEPPRDPAAAASA